MNYWCVNQFKPRTKVYSGVSTWIWPQTLFRLSGIRQKPANKLENIAIISMHEMRVLISICIIINISVISMHEMPALIRISIILPIFSVRQLACMRCVHWFALASSFTSALLAMLITLMLMMMLMLINVDTHIMHSNLACTICEHWSALASSILYSIGLVLLAFTRCLHWFAFIASSLTLASTCNSGERDQFAAVVTRLAKNNYLPPGQPTLHEMVANADVRLFNQVVANPRPRTCSTHSTLVITLV